MAPPYRADHVGSLLRPPELLQARRDSSNDAETTAVEDAAILRALDLQRDAGLDIFSDGEYRRRGWAAGFPAAVSGYVPGEPPLRLAWHLGEREDAPEVNPLAGTPLPTGGAYRVVGGRVRAERRIAAADAAFLNRHVPDRFKITIPAPSYNVARGWKPGVTDGVYASRAELSHDVATIIGAELGALAAEGVTYLQLDNPHLPDYLTEAKRAEWRSIGVDPDQALAEDLVADNLALVGLDRTAVTVACHICRGNAASAWHATGSYDAIAEQVFSTLEVDRWLLEYDSDRAGGFEPLRFMPAGRIVVLGLITTKEGPLEDVDALLRRIDDAARFVPLDQLAISPQCGFASVEAGNLLSWDDQRRKLELVATIARRVWG